MLEEKKTLEDQLEEAERRRAEAEKGRAEGRSEENKICLLGDSFCLNVPSFGGVSTGIFLLGVVLGLVCGCRCDTSRLCSIFNCCCPASARDIIKIAGIATANSSNNTQMTCIATAVH